MLRFPLLILLAVCSLGFATISHAQKRGDLAVRFIYSEDDIPPQKTAALAGVGAVQDESLVINPANQGVQNVVLWLDADRSQWNAAETDPSFAEIPEAKTLTLVDERLEPRITIIRAGQNVRIVSQDLFGYSLNFNFLRNQKTNVVVQPLAERQIRTKVAEPAPIRVEDNIRPSVSAWLLVVGHPYAGVSDANGVLVIEKLPANRELVFRMFHEVFGATDEVEVNGETRKLTKNRLDLELDPGVNTLEVTIPALDP